MKTFLPFLLILVAVGVGADPRTSYGVAFGPEIGYGLSLRHENGPQGFQVTGIPVISNSNAFVTLGLQGFRTFHETPMTRFFGYLGAAAIYNNGPADASAGLGYGLELILLDHLVFDVQFGLGVGWSYGVVNAGLRAQGGVFYRL